MSPIPLLTCFGPAHPVLQIFVDHLQLVASALVDPAEVKVVHCSHAEPWRGLPGERASSVRIENIDALDLATCWLADGAARLAEIQDDVRRIERAHALLPAISLEEALGSPIVIAGFLAEQFGVPLRSAAIACAERHQPALVRACLPLLHPMGFVEALGRRDPPTIQIPPFAGVTAQERLIALIEERRAQSVLIVADEDVSRFADIASARDRPGATIELRARSGREYLDEESIDLSDLIWFDRIEGRDDLRALFDRARRGLRPHGAVAGSERSYTAAIRMLAKFTEPDVYRMCRIQGPQWEVTFPSREVA